MDELQVRAALRDELSGPLQGLRDEVRRMARETRKSAGDANIAARGFDGLARSLGSVARIAGRGALITVGAVGTAATAAGTAAVVMGVKTAAAMQTANIGFTTMLGSAEKAGAFLEKLKKFAAATPFEFPELQTAASSLISIGVATDDVIPIMTTLGNVTSGMGTGSEGIQRATVAIQQMIAANRVQAEDLNQLRDAGIPVYDLLAAAMGKTKAEVADLASKGKLGKDALGAMMEALKSGKGLERFNGLMEKQSASLSGVWSTLKDNVNMGLADAIAPAIPTLTKFVALLGDKAGVILPQVSAALVDLAGKGRGLYTTFRGLGLQATLDLFDRMVGGGGKVGGALWDVWRIVRALGAILRGVFGPAVSDGASTVRDQWAPALDTAADVAEFLARHTTALRWAVGLLVTALVLGKAAQVGVNVVNGIAAGVEAALTAKKHAGTAATWLRTTANRVANSTAVTYIGVLGLEAAATTRAALASGRDALAKGAAATARGVSTLYTYIGVLTLEAISSGRSAIATAAHTTAMVASRIAMGAARIAVLAWTGAQWLLNVALNANPIGLIVLAIAALIAIVFGLVKGVQYAYEHWGWFRTAVDATGDALKAFGGWCADIGKAIGTWIVDKVKEAVDWFGKLGDKISNSAVGKLVGGWFGGGEDAPVGDTSSSRAHGHGHLAGTLAGHGAAMSASGSRPRITNVWTGGGGRGRGSGDHQAGRALDLVGPGLSRYASAIREQGGYAAFHGEGAGRHLHAVPAQPMGDTSSSMARSVAVREPGPSGGGTVLNVTVNVYGADSEIDVERAVAAGIARAQRDASERGAA